MITNCTPTHPLIVRFQLVYKPYVVNDLVSYRVSYHIIRFHILDKIQQGLCRPALAWFEVKYLLVCELKIAHI